ncbi:MAG: hypothetical protein L3J51_05885 [Cocleimonas sp.]|nr:hypothetical protein [Cocleimonas sp.]
MDTGKKSFLWLVAVFVAPILLGTLLFFNLERLGFEKGSVNYGVLVQPAFPVQVHDLMLDDKVALREETLAKKWTMLYIEPDECDKLCLDRLLLIKRVRILMNEQMRRVRTTLVSNKEIDTSILKKQNPDLVLTHVDMAASDFLKQYPEVNKSPIYLHDPLGNLMMYYPQVDLDAKKMIKDLLKLLKYSHLG